jgi:hypothetical protein
MGQNVVSIGQAKCRYCLRHVDSNCPVFCAGFIAWASHLLFAGATPVIAGWFVGCTWKSSGTPNCLPIWFCNFCTIYTIYKCVIGSHAARGLQFGDPCFTVYWDGVIGLALFNRLLFPATFLVDINNLLPSRALGNLMVYMDNKNSFIFKFKRQFFTFKM